VGDTLFTESLGHVIFYFYPGDQGPYGEVGVNGGYYHVVGLVKQTYDIPNDVVTSFKWVGRATDICGLIS
jgi:hypothetical protein